MELSAWALELDRPDEGRLPFLGRAAHAWLLGRTAGVDPALAERLHNEAGPAPFTCAFLPLERSKGLLRVTALTEGVTAALDKALEGLEGGEIVLDDRPFRVRRVYREGHPWAGRTTYANLALGWLRRLPKAPPRKVGLRLLTPTAFRRHGITDPLPRPEAVFGSLLERWNTFSPQAFSPALRRFLEEEVVLTRLEGRTQAVPLAGAVHIGLVGRVDYSAIRPDPYWLTFLHILADFAFFAGVGAKTTMGMGLSRREEWPPSI